MLRGRKNATPYGPRPAYEAGQTTEDSLPSQFRPYAGEFKARSALFMRREEMLNAEQKDYLERLCASDPALADARRLTQDFAKMVRNLEGERLDGWLEEAAGAKHR